MAAGRQAARSLSLVDARALALAAQGLLPAAGGGSAPAADLVERHGLLRTLGGIDAYLALRARRPGVARAEIDAAVAAGELRIRPAARGCIYVVTGALEYAALAVADELSRPRAEREQERAGIEEGEIERVAAAVVELLRTGPATTDGVRRALPGGVVRSLGATGRKLGISSTLPPALRRLELDGAIERLPQGGRLDTERYVWRIRGCGPLPQPSGGTRADDPFSIFAELFFRAAGIATLEQFAAWAGCGKRRAKEAAEGIGLTPVAIDGIDGGHLVPASQRSLLDEPPALAGQVALLGFEDNALALHGGPGLFVDPQHRDLEVPAWGRGRATRLGDAGHLFLRTILVDGALAGFWELDSAAGEIACATFSRLPEATAGRLAEEARRLFRFIADELGHARIYSLDNEEALARRLAAVRALAAA